MQEYNDFFQKSPDTPMVLAGKITRRLKPSAVKQGSKNMLHPVAARFFFSVLFLVEDYRNVARFANLLAKGLFTLGLILEGCQNHWEIDRYSQEAFKLF
jgi:hypothetical protein